jgi:Tol biopolymer transport system component
MRRSSLATVVAALAAALALAHLAVEARQESKEPKWDVSALQGPTRTVSFDTSEGTWMNVDVSPDGTRIVFDLLGDIYIMPIEGSGSTAARRLTGGATFDMQPRFSPDATRIAFTSDRDGLWNIWTMDLDGKSARQISRDRRWFINSPTWSSDGQYIYARRHFVKERSLGAGEIWMYHASGPSDGLQVTERTGWQKDNGEPAVSPDGRYLYYSKDVTPGTTFEYNKDPNGTIYAIIRRDLVTGRERRAVSVQGGSVAPRVSPDGRTLAYIRRVRLKSALFLRDLESGRDRQLFGRVDKDLQEAWAIHGLYPQYAWTPDGRSIVIWGEGRIWRVDAATGAAAEVPFTVRVEQTVAEPLRVTQRVHPEEFPVRMLRDVRVAPDGRAVIYSALGRLYVRPLPKGEPRRLTDSEALEFSPSYSRDGEWIVYVTWTDEEMGRVRVERADGSGGRDVVTRPGHYVEPSFSPDGRLIVFRRAGPDQARGPVLCRRSGHLRGAVRRRRARARP